MGMRCSPTLMIVLNRCSILTLLPLALSSFSSFSCFVTLSVRVSVLRLDLCVVAEAKAMRAEKVHRCCLTPMIVANSSQLRHRCLVMSAPKPVDSNLNLNC